MLYTVNIRREAHNKIDNFKSLSPDDIYENFVYHFIAFSDGEHIKLIRRLSTNGNLAMIGNCCDWRSTIENMCCINIATIGSIHLHRTISMTKAAPTLFAANICER